MAGKRKAAPEKFWDSGSKQYHLILRDQDGQRRRYRLGADPEKAERERLRLLAEWLESQAAPTAQPSLTVADACAAYAQHVLVTGTDQRTVDRVRAALSAVETLYGDRPATEFGPKALKAVRAWLLTQPDRRVKRGRGRTLSRQYVNKLIRAIQKAWKWLASEELIPNDRRLALESVDALEKTVGVREAPAINAVEPATVAATLPHCHPILAAMIRVQLLCGMRPGEVVLMRRRDLSCDPKESVVRDDLPPARAVIEDNVLCWAYVPCYSKGDKHNRPRIIAVPPEAQAVLQPFLADRPVDAYLFSPAEAMAAFRAGQRRARVSPVQPSQVDRSKGKPKKAPGEMYSTQSYGRAVVKACARAGVPKWLPNQLRHLLATEVYDLLGMEQAQSILGHAPGSQITKRHYIDETIRKAAQAVVAAGKARQAG